MERPSVSAYAAKYSRIAAGSQIVRAATAVFDAPVEFVLLDTERAMIVAATTATSCQPRIALPAEQAMLAADSSLERTGDSTAVRVAVADGLVGGLSIALGLGDLDQTKLTEFACELSQALADAETQKFATRQFEAAVLDGLREAVIVLDQQLSVAWCNDSVVTLLGWGPDELVGRRFVELIHPDDIERAVDAAMSLSGGHRISRLNLRVRTAYGSWEPVSITGFDHSADPAIGGLVVSLRNGERELESERALDESRRISTTILQNLQEAVIATDEVGAITIMNDAARQLFSIPSDTAVASLAIADIKLLDEAGEPLSAGAHPLRPSPLWADQDLKVYTEAGIRHVQASRSVVQLEQGHFGIVVTFVDMTQAYSDALELRSRALHDQLTGLANRRYLSERLQTLNATDQNVRLAACFIDIDKFKNVNDIHGHRVGDAVLKATARRLRSGLGGRDILARPGGDEFLVILVNPASSAAAIEVAERIRAVFDRPFEVEGNRLHLSASVGLAFREDDGPFDEERLLQHADIALFAAKDRGRDRVEVFDQALATTVARENDQRNMVRDALDNDRVQMHFQTIVDANGATIGVEALARCIDNAGNLVLPMGFMDAIDGTSLMVRLDRASFEQSCQLAALLEMHPRTQHMWVAANFSAMTLAQSDFTDMILRTILDTGVSPTSLCIEVTETAAFEPGDSAIKSLTALHQAGLRIALDDFGTGYSSLSHLRDLPLTTVKIDRSFTSALLNHGAERAIASAVRDIADSLGFNVVAEGVETAADKAAVADIGVKSMQGWYFARAVSQTELLENLEIDSRQGANTASPSQ